MSDLLTNCLTTVKCTYIYNIIYVNPYRVHNYMLASLSKSYLPTFYQSYLTHFGSWGKGTVLAVGRSLKVPPNMWQVERKSTCPH